MPKERLKRHCRPCRKRTTFAVQTGLADPAWCLAWEANIHLKEGDWASAMRWAEASGLSPDDEPQYLRIESLLVYGRILLAQTRLADTRRWLARLECFTRERGLYRWLLTVHILQALASQRSGQHSVARDHLSQALKIAAPEDFFRAFLDEDEQLMALLPEVRHVAPSFVDRLLSYAGIANFQSTAAVQSCPVEPLSDREMQVLRLMAAGLSGPEIAEHLVVAVSTARSHIKSIYGKLGAHSRHEAIERARTLRLLDRSAR